MHIRIPAILGMAMVAWYSFFYQQVSADQSPNTNSPTYLTTRWTTENGLPQNSVTAIAQTPDGYLWIGTFGGLARFDGVKFTIFNSSNTPTLRSNRITALHLGRSGSLWIGSENGEITRLHNGKFSLFTDGKNEAKNSGYVRIIYEDRDGSVWISTKLIGVRRYIAGDPAKGQDFDDRHGLPRSSVQSICEDNDGALWVCATTGLTLFHKKQNSFTIESGINDFAPWMFKIHPHPKGGLWLLTQQSLNRFHNGQITVVAPTSFNSDLDTGLCETQAGEMLLSNHSNSLSIIRPNEALTQIKLETGKPSVVQTLFEDREGHIWMGTVGSGLLRLQRRRVTMLNVATGLPNVGSNSVLEDNQGNLWIGTGNGLCRVSSGKVTTYTTPARHELRGGYRVGALHQGRDGTLWFGLGNFLVRYYENRFTEYLLPDVDLISAITEDRKGQMWLGSLYGLMQFQDGKTVTYTKQHGLVSNDVKRIYEDRAGALWLGTPGGLSRFQDGRFTNFTTREGLSNNYVRDIYEDQSGALWLGTYGGGLNRLYQGRITHITTQQGLYDDFVSRILVDEHDDFWMLGNHGIFRVNRQALVDVAEGRSKSVHCVLYNEADGMQPSEGQGGHQPAGWRGRDGKFYFPTIGGVAVVDPSLSKQLPPLVHIKRVSLDGQEMDFSQPIEISPGKGNLEIQYTGLSLGKPEQMRFSFRLSGMSEDWNDVGLRRIAYFPQLQPGQFTFSVKALSPDGVWSEQTANLSVLVRPHFWQTVWFWSLAAMAFAGLVLVGYHQREAILRARIERQEAFSRQLIISQEQERQRIAAELHDGLGQSLIIIKRRGLLCLEAGEDREEMLEQLQEIIEASTHAIEEVREMIFDLRPQQLDRLGLTGAVSDLLTRAASVNNWQLTKQLDEVDGLFSKEAENSLYRIVQESIHNISKHAAATNVVVSIERQSHWVDLAVQDNGRGFVMADNLPVEWQTNLKSAIHNPQSNGFGLRGIAERARFLGGQAIIESALSRGTTVRLRLPLKESK